MTLEENLADLTRHARDFETGRGFTFTVLDPVDDDVIGCVYSSIPPTSTTPRCSRGCGPTDLDVPPADAVAHWIATDWPWRHPDRMGR